MDQYSTPQLLQVAEMTHPTFKARVRRGHLRFSMGDKPGTGNHRRHTATDVLQAVVMVRLGRVGVRPARAAMFWPIIQSALHHPEALLLLAHLPDGSDTDFRLVLPGGDADMDTTGAPTVFAGLNIGPLKREVAAKLAALA